MSAQRQRAVFVDRDGVLNEMVYDETHGLLDSPRRVEQVKLMPGAARFIKGVKDLGYAVIVASNQPGVAKGTLTFEELEAVNRRIAELLEAEGARWDAVRCCCHHPDGKPEAGADLVRKCQCRKPEPGLLMDAARELGLEMTGSWMVGDGLTDVQAGRAAGCRTILVTKLKIEQIERFVSMEKCEPEFVAANLDQALEIIRENRVP